MGILSRFFNLDRKSEPASRDMVSGKRLVVANWKCHKSTDEARKWFDVFAAGYTPSAQLEVVVAPTFLCLEGVASHLQDLKLENVSLAAQDISPFPRGGYTGAVSADMVRGMANYVILGHSERRRYFHETNLDVTNKVLESVDAGLRPIVCLDESIIEEQLASLADVDNDSLVLAYSPVDALSFRIPESPERVSEAAARIRSIYPAKSIIYGGALSSDNVSDYLVLPELNGVFIGSASLAPETFLEMCRKVI